MFVLVIFFSWKMKISPVMVSSVSKNQIRSLSMFYYHSIWNVFRPRLGDYTVVYSYLLWNGSYNNPQYRMEFLVFRPFCLFSSFFRIWLAQSKISHRIWVTYDARGWSHTLDFPFKANVEKNLSLKSLESRRQKPNRASNNNYRAESCHSSPSYEDFTHNFRQSSQTIWEQDLFFTVKPKF